jgi:NAD-dependent SIR2 family protein deacetylase
MKLLHRIYLLNLLTLLMSKAAFGQQAVLVRDITNGVNSTNPKSIVAYKNKVYFLVKNTTTNNNQIYSSDLTTAGTSLNPDSKFSNRLIIGNLAVTDSTLPDGTQLPRHSLFFVSKVLGLRSVSSNNLNEFDGTNDDVLRNLDESLSKTETSPITDVELSTTTQPESDRYQSHINPITKHGDSSTYYSNMGFNSFSDSLLWSQEADYDNTSQNLSIFPNTRTWFFTRKKRLSEDDAIRNRDDNAQGTTTSQAFLQDSMVGIASGYFGGGLNDISFLQRTEARFMFFSNLNGVKKLKSLHYPTGSLTTGIPTEPYLIQESDPLSIDIKKAGIYHQHKVYFQTPTNEIWSCGFKGLKPKLFFNSPTADNLTLINNDRAFFTAKNTFATNGGIFEIINDNSFLCKQFQAGEVLQKFFTLKGLYFAVTKRDSIYTFYRMDGELRIPALGTSINVLTLGTAINVDISAGFALNNRNILVMSANSKTVGKGQELYKLTPQSFTTVNCTNKPEFLDCPSNDITVNPINIGGTTATVTLPAVTVTDACGLGTPFIVPSFLPQNITLPLGDTVVTYSATNTNGISYCSFKVRVRTNFNGNCATDNIKPIIRNCPKNTVYFSFNSGERLNHQITLGQLHRDNGQDISLFPNFSNRYEAYDNCTSQPTIETNIAMDSILKSNVLYTINTRAVDAKLNKSDLCTFTFKYINLSCFPDTLPPTISSCPSEIAIFVSNATICSRVADTTNLWRDPRIVDYCNPPILTLSHPKTTCFQKGLTRVKYLVKDAQGLKDSCTFNVAVIPTSCLVTSTPSVSNCSSTITVFTKTDSAVVSWRAPTFTDAACFQLVIDSTHKSGSKFRIGTTPVSYVATNSRGNTRSCNFNVIVNRCVAQTIRDTIKTCNPRDTGSVTNSLTNRFGCDSIVIKTTVLKRRDSIDRVSTICSGDSIKIGTTVFRTAGQFRIALINKEGCDSIIILKLSVTPKDTSRLSALTCDPTKVGETTQTVKRTGLCDLVVITNTTLKVIPPKNLQETICQGQTFRVGTQPFTQAGNFTVKLKTTEGCDSTVNLALTVNQKDTIRTLNTSCSVIQTTIDSTRTTNSFGCERLVVTITTPGTKDTSRVSALTCDPTKVGETKQTIIRAGQCDLVIITNTTLKVIPPKNLQETICQGQSIRVGTEVFTQTGNFTIKLKNTEGCDSTVILALTVNKKDTIRTTNTSCTVPQTVMDTVRTTNSFGCERLTITTTIPGTKDTSRVSTVTCDPTKVGETKQTITRTGQCDLVIITNTTLKVIPTKNLQETICQGQSIRVGTEVFTQTGNFTIKLKNTEGCDSTVILALTVNKKDTIRTTNSSCTVPQTVIDTVRTTNSFGCERLTITTTIPGTKDTSRVSAVTCDPTKVGETKQTIIRQGQCDLVIITNTTLKVIPTKNLQETICQGQSIRVGTEVFNQTGNFTIKLKNTEGCDSTVILALTVNKKDTIRTSTISCTVSQTVIDTSRTTNGFGCERLVIKTTTPGAKDTFRIDKTSCDPTQVGVITKTIPRAGKCDSVVVTTTVLRDVQLVTLDTTLCPGKTIIFGTQVFATSGNFFFRVRSNNGCDTVVSMKLTVLKADTVRTQTTTCFTSDVGRDTQRIKSRLGCDSLIKIITRVFSTTDTVKPVLAGCPPNITVIATDIDRKCSVVQWVVPKVTDNCTSNIVPVSSIPENAGFCFPIGITTVTYTATDQQRNSSTCTFTVKVTCPNDTIKPVFKDCPKLDTVFLLKTTTNCSFFNYIEPTATDNCGIEKITNSNRSGDCFPVNVLSTILYQATDYNGNTAICQFKVRVSPFTKTIETDTIISKMRLTPNPTTGELYLFFESKVSQDINFQFYDAIGRLISKEKRKIVSGENNVEFDVRQFSTGVFWLIPSLDNLTIKPIRFVKM